MNNKHFVSNSTESIRMFKYDWMEALSKVHWTVPLYIYIPVILFCFWKGLFDLAVNPLVFLAALVGGVFIWTFTEYVLHRFVFHFVPKAPWALRLHFIFHGVHHDYPNDAKRLVMPPSASIPLALLFFWLFSLIMPAEYLYPFFAGFIGGYLVYDISHYALHHFNFKGEFWKKLKKHHMHHHYAEPERGFGVSSDFWDKVFGSGFNKK